MCYSEGMIYDQACDTSKSHDTARVIHLGARVLRRVLGQVLACRYLRAAVSCDPNLPLRGRVHTRTRVGLVVVKRMFRLWLWVQANGVEMPPQTQSPQNPKRERRKNISRPPSLKRFSPQKTATENPCNDAIIAALSAQGFGPKVRLWETPKRKKPLARNPVDLPILTQARAWLLADVDATAGDLQRVYLPRSVPNLSPARGVSGVTAGQAYTDLHYISTVLDAPDRAITRLARHKHRVETKRAAALHVYAKPPPRVVVPKPPTANHLRILGGDRRTMQWVREVGFEGIPKRHHRNHPPPHTIPHPIMSANCGQA